MKKYVCRLTAMSVLCALMLSLCACGGEGGMKENANTGKLENGKTVWYLGGAKALGSEDPSKYFQNVADTVDPAKIYSSVELTEKMLYGAYTLNDKEADLKTVRKEIPFENVSVNGKEYSMTVLPTAVYLGAENICSSETKYNYSQYKAIKDYEVAVLELALEEKVAQIPCTYALNGNTITFKQIRQTSEAEQPLTYEFTGLEFTYSFAIAGPYLTLTKGDKSLKLKAYCLTKNTDYAPSVTGYSLPDSPLIGSLDYFASSENWNYAVRRDGSYYDISAYKMDDEGRFTVYLAEKDLVSGETQAFVQQYAYILQSEASNFLTDFGIILLDGQKTYYYTDNIAMREARALEEQGVDVSAITEDEIEQIAKKKADLFDELQEEFAQKGINATINRSTGEIALDSTVLFKVNESEIAGEGKEFLQKFMSVYTAVVFGEKYKDFISKIMVEGHTDTKGSYELNQSLSKARADSVKEYCLSEECGVDAAIAQQLEAMLEAVGYAYDKPVYDENGEVDMDASRRVSFRFIVNVEK